MLNNFSKKSPPCHVTQDDVSSPLFQRLEVEKITGHQSVRGRGEVIAVVYETHWTGLPRSSWEREMDLQLSRHHILRYTAGTPNERRQTNRLYRRMRTGAAQRELSRSSGERLLAPGDGCVSHADWLRRYSTTVLPNGAHFKYNGHERLWWLEKISAIDYGWGIFVSIFGLPGTEQASSFSDAPHDFNRSCACTQLARLHGRSNVTYMNLEAQPWMI